MCNNLFYFFFCKQNCETHTDAVKEMERKKREENRRKRDAEKAKKRAQKKQEQIDNEQSKAQRKKLLQYRRTRAMSRHQMPAEVTSPTPENEEENKETENDELPPELQIYLMTPEVYLKTKLLFFFCRFSQNSHIC